MPAVRIRHVLITDDRGDALATYLAARRSDLDSRVRTASTLTESDPQWADALVGFATPISLDRSSIRWVHSTGAGVDGLLGGKRWPDGVTLTRTTGALGARMAEYCVGHALAVTQRIREFHCDQRAGRWAPVEPGTLQGTTAVIIGTGSVGSAIATRFAALGCSTIGVSRSGQPTPPFDHVHPVGGLTDTVTEARWLVLAAPLTAETRGLVGAAVLGGCRDTVVINVARGGLLDTAALLDALALGTVTAAVLDVFDTEPLPPDSPLWRSPDVVITPHIAGVTHVEEAGAAFLDALTHLESDRRPPSAVDPTRGY
jgi:phosphoglycerate dehydrogenase-like enzyme